MFGAWCGEQSSVALKRQWQHYFPRGDVRKGYALKQAKVLTDAELKRVLAVISQGKHAPRNRLAVLLSHYAGLRVGEMAVLTWGMLLDSRGAVVTSFHLLGKHTKTGEARTVHVSAKLAKEVLTYRAALSAEPKPQAAIIASQKGDDLAFAYRSLSLQHETADVLPVQIVQLDGSQPGVGRDVHIAVED